MGLIVDLGEVIDVDVGIFLCGRQADMPQQLLDRAQIRAHLQQVGGKRMAQGMRGDRHPDPCP